MYNFEFLSLITGSSCCSISLTVINGNHSDFGHSNRCLVESCYLKFSNKICCWTSKNSGNHDNNKYLALSMHWSHSEHISMSVCLVQQHYRVGSMINISLRWEYSGEEVCNLVPTHVANKSWRASEIMLDRNSLNIDETYLFWKF